MQKLLLAFAAAFILLTSCEVEVRNGLSYRHHMGDEHEHNPAHHEVYYCAYDHDGRGNDIVMHNEHAGH